MTDMPGSRLWPLALMGWLAAMPPAAADMKKTAASRPSLEVAEPEPGQRAAWLSAARARYAALPADERDRLRRQRRGQRGEPA